MDKDLPHIKHILEIYKGTTININKINEVCSIDDIKIENLFMKEHLYVKNKTVMFNNIYMYDNIYIFYMNYNNNRSMDNFGFVHIFDNNKRCYYWYKIWKNYIHKNVINYMIQSKIVWKKQYLNFFCMRGKHIMIFIYTYNKYKYSYKYNGKIRNDKYKANNRLIYI
jgi:hypothetical protein